MTIINTQCVCIAETMNKTTLQTQANLKLLLLLLLVTAQDRPCMVASINGKGRTQENPWKVTLTQEKLLAIFLMYPHWPSLTLEPTQTVVRL